MLVKTLSVFDIVFDTFEWDGVIARQVKPFRSFPIYSTTQRDWLNKNSRHFFIQSKRTTKTNRGSLEHVFPRFASATCIYFEFDWSNGFVSFVIGWS